MARVVDVTPDKEEARSLKKMADRTLERIAETDRQRFTTQIVKDYYDVIHYLLEGTSVALGKKVKGRGAHAELISLISEKFELEEGVEEFLQNLRKFRNRIAYEGFSVEMDYLKRNESTLEETIEHLKSILRDILEK